MATIFAGMASVHCKKWHMGSGFTLICMYNRMEHTNDIQKRLTDMTGVWMT